MGIAYADSYLTFQAVAFQVNSSGGHNKRKFSVLCGDEPPTIIDGYGIWQVLNRPLRQGIPIPQGFNPAKMQFNVRFGIWDGSLGFKGWDTSSGAAQTVEDQIDDLHWMAGGNSLGGPSPVVYVNAYGVRDGQKISTNLVPRQYHKVPWIIDSGITWGVSLRHRNGSRVYQEAAFTMVGYESPLGTNKPPPDKGGTSGGFFKTKLNQRTTRAIAASLSSEVAPALVKSLARKICKADQNNPCHKSSIKLERRSIDWKIPVGIDVWVPAH